MDTLLHRFGSIIKGTIEGFDRLVFKGLLKPLAYAKGMEMFIRTQSVLNKDYKTWAMDQSLAIIEIAEKYAKENSERGGSITNKELQKNLQVRIGSAK